MITVLLSALLLAPDAPATNAPPPVESSKNEEVQKKKRKACKAAEEDIGSKIRRRTCKVEDVHSPAGESPSDNAH